MTRPQALSGLSPYFHFGQLSAQRAALEAKKHRKAAAESVDSFLEEAVVRRELSDNFCFYEDDYDRISCASGWARETLQKHASDEREHVYSLYGPGPPHVARMYTCTDAMPRSPLAVWLRDVSCLCGTSGTLCSLPACELAASQ